MLSNKLKMLRASKSITQAGLASMLGLTQQAVAKWERGKAEPDHNTLLKLSDYFGVSTDELLGRPVYADKDKIYGNKERLQSGKSWNDSFPLHLPGLNIVPLPDENARVPILGSVRCGPGGFAYEDVEGYILVEEKHKDEYFALRCKGDSMEPDIREGDIAVVRKQDTVGSGQVAVVTIDAEEGTLKRVRYRFNKNDRPEMMILESSNPKYEPRIFLREEMNRAHICGLVVQIRRAI